MLLLARAILKLNPAPLFKESSTVNAAISRLKAKILSIVSPRAVMSFCNFLRGLTFLS